MKRPLHAALPVALLLGCLAPCLAGCNEEPLKQVSADAGAGVAGLTSDEAARVIAKVGDRTITLGDFARAVERMDQYDRLRYQSKERRHELLEEMIDVQLLADEAKRRGLDKDPETQEALRMILRDAMLAQAREGLPAPAQLTEQDVRAFYDAHADKFVEPERRRVAAIVMSEKKDAEKVLKEALKVKSATEWGELVKKHSLTAPKHKGPASPTELAGDLGIVGPMNDPKGANLKVPDPVRAVAFKLKDVNEISPELVEAEGRFFIVRLAGVSPPHQRALAQADKAIRVLLVQQKLAERERALEADLKKQFPVQIDEGALGTVKLPQGAEKAEHTAFPPEAEHEHEEADGGS